MIESAAVVFPHPDSPARPRDSPSPREKSTPPTARTIPSVVSKWTLRPCTSRSGNSAPPEAGVEDLVERVPQEGERHDHDHDREAWRDDPPVQPVFDRGVLEGLFDHDAPGVRVRGPEADEIGRAACRER